MNSDYLLLTTDNSVSADKEEYMKNNNEGTGIKLSGRWDSSGVVMQIEALSSLHQLAFAMEKHCRIDCSEISNVDMTGLQLLHAWLQCISFHGVNHELINLPEGMQQTIKRMGLENSFSGFYSDAAREPSHATN